jgi:UDP-glucose 4-epimerase
MQVLITGGFGNVGMSVIHELVRRGHQVTVFELESKRNKKTSQSFNNQITVAWGDLLKPSTLDPVLDNNDVIIHLAAIIPPASEANEALCFKVNVTGTRNLISSIKARARQPAVVFTSSVSVMGLTQARVPPINPYDPPNPTTNYTRSKVEGEHDLAASRLRWCTCRLGAVLSSQSALNTDLIKEVFNMNLENRLEMVLDLDVATALANAAELMARGDAAQGKILNIGGGKQGGFQRHGRDLTIDLFKRMGIGALNERCFSKKEYFIDWMDTIESQSLLSFQNHSFDEAIALFLKPFKKLRPFMRLFSPLIRRSLERQSPWYPG